MPGYALRWPLWAGLRRQAGWLAGWLAGMADGCPGESYMHRENMKTQVNLSQFLL
jgi:hypothetical protein